MKTPSRSIVCFALLCLCLLPACGKEAPAAPREAPAITAVLPDAALHKPEAPAPSPEAAPEPETDTALRDSAAAYVGRPAEELIRQYGEPEERRYAPSCLGPGQDGELRYEGFTVYTYKLGESEVITNVD